MSDFSVNECNCCLRASAADLHSTGGDTLTCGVDDGCSRDKDAGLHIAENDVCNDMQQVGPTPAKGGV